MGRSFGRSKRFLDLGIRSGSLKELFVEVLVFLKPFWKTLDGSGNRDNVVRNTRVAGLHLILKGTQEVSVHFEHFLCQMFSVSFTKLVFYHVSLLLKTKNGCISGCIHSNTLSFIHFVYQSPPKHRLHCSVMIESFNVAPVLTNQIMYQPFSGVGG